MRPLVGTPVPASPASDSGGPVACTARYCAVTAVGAVPRFAPRTQN